MWKIEGINPKLEKQETLLTRLKVGLHGPGGQKRNRFQSLIEKVIEKNKKSLYCSITDIQKSAKSTSIPCDDFLQSEYMCVISPHIKEQDVASPSEDLVIHPQSKCYPLTTDTVAEFFLPVCCELYINVIMHNIFFCFWLLSFNVVFVRFINVLTSICSLFIFVAVEHSMVS